MSFELPIQSIGDTDTYKLSMMQGVINHFSRYIAGYQFINRGQTAFPDRFNFSLQEGVEAMSDLRLLPQEEEYLRKNCGQYLKPSFLDTLRGYHFNPEQVTISQTGGNLGINIEGPWYQTILWEVPLMALISELYFEATGQKTKEGWIERARQKANALREAWVRFADFGTRRRFSFNVQKTVVEIMKEIALPIPRKGEQFDPTKHGVFTGTSNVHLAMLYDLIPIGTVAHEWFMAIAAIYGYRMATSIAIETWAKEFGGELGIALSDTFTTQEFLRHFNKYYAKLFDGVRQDSGDPFEILKMVIAHYLSLGIDPLTKTIVFGDNLDVPKILALAEACRNLIQCSFGIGTNFTNDVGVIPLNMVIKLSHIILPDGVMIPAVKLSDSKGKYTGDPEEIAMAIRELRLPLQSP